MLCKVYIFWYFHIGSQTRSPLFKNIQVYSLITTLIEWESIKMNLIGYFTSFTLLNCVYIMTWQYFSMSENINSYSLWRQNLFFWLSFQIRKKMFQISFLWWIKYNRCVKTEKKNCQCFAFIKMINFTWCIF